MLAEAYRRLRTRPGIGDIAARGRRISRARAPAYLDGITSDLNDWGLAGQFEYRGEVDRAQKIDFLRSLDVLSVPATYEEPKGMFLLEAMANGVPVVQPRRGAFPEIVETTGGGLIVEADDPEALADGLLRRSGGIRRAPRRSAPPARRRPRALQRGPDGRVGRRRLRRAGGVAGQRARGVTCCSAENISKSYPTPRGALPILTDVSLTLNRGEAIAIMGPSGSGKSTLLYILGALDAAVDRHA